MKPINLHDDIHASIKDISDKHGYHMQTLVNGVLQAWIKKVTGDSHLDTLIEIQDRAKKAYTESMSTGLSELVKISDSDPGVPSHG